MDLFQYWTMAMYKFRFYLSCNWLSSRTMFISNRLPLLKSAVLALLQTFKLTRILQCGAHFVRSIFGMHLMFLLPKNFFGFIVLSLLMNVKTMEYISFTLVSFRK